MNLLALDTSTEWMSIALQRGAGLECAGRAGAGQRRYCVWGAQKQRCYQFSSCLRTPSGRKRLI